MTNLLGTPRLRENSSADAVIIVPGIMGSRLVERDTGRTLWGLGSISRYIARWKAGEGLADLAVSEQERRGEVGRIKADGLLKTPEWAPTIGGIEPYTQLVKRLERTVVHPDALLSFAYDWRLSVEFNAGLLAKRAHDHLLQWEQNSQRRFVVQEGRGESEPRLVLVAHSMGGLVCAAMCRLFPDVAARVRATITLGTPFRGAVKAIGLLNTGRGAPIPLPRERLRDLARTLPGVHDLLPSYRCMDTGKEVVSLSPEHLEELGADPELVARSIRSRPLFSPDSLPDHHMVVGYNQRTDISLSMDGKRVELHRHGFQWDHNDDLLRDTDGKPARVPRSGDGTVYRYSAAPGGRYVTLAQQHGALARSASALDIVCGVVTQVPPGTALGGDQIGLSVSDLGKIGEPLDITIEHVTDASLAGCEVEDALDRTAPTIPIDLHRSRSLPDALTARWTPREPGLFRVRAMGGSDPVTRLVLVLD